MSQGHNDLLAEIEHQLRRGDHRAAAIGYEEIGELNRARALYEGLFDYVEAGRLAVAEGDDVGALGLYLKAGLVQEAEKVRRAMMADLSDELPQALELFEQRGFHLQAAELAESIGRLGRAAELYRQASDFGRAAVLLERLGRLREAGEAYEQTLVGQPADAAANLGLGRILQRFGRHREALKLLGRASRAGGGARGEATRRIAYAFFKLGFLESGRTALVMAGVPRNTEPAAFMRPFEDELQQADGGADAAVEEASGALEGRYRLEKALGGRLGAAFLGTDLLSSRAVVLRFFAGSTADNMAFYEELERLRLAQLRGHVRLLEINKPGGFVVSEYVQGSNLLTLLQGDSPPDAQRCRGYTLQILDAVMAAHRVGVIHGALTPSSVRLGPGGSCVVDDWGVRHIEKQQATQTGGPESTFAYRAPELNIGRQADFRADLYGVAAILYRCLVGRAPMMGRGQEGLEDWPEAFGLFFAQALAASPEDRHSNHDTFRRALRGLPWAPVARRRLDPPEQVDVAREQSEGPRFVVERAPEPGETVTARDTLLGRDVRLLRLPPSGQRPVHLVDRLTALAGPEVPVFQDILRYDAAGEAIVLEKMRGVAVADMVALQGTIEPVVALDAAEPLLVALAAAHREGIGLGSVRPETIVYDGAGLRAPIEQALLAQGVDVSELINRDVLGFWQGLLLAIDGQIPPNAGPVVLVQSLRQRRCLLARDVSALSEQAPAPTASMAPAPEWYDALRRAVAACQARQALFDRLSHVVKSDGSLSSSQEAFIAERRRLFGLD